MITDTFEETTEESSRAGWRRGLIAFGLVLIIGVLSFKIFEPVQVLPRIRLAPGFIMTDQVGQSVTSEDLKGSVVLYTFTYTNCGEDCVAPEDTIRDVKARVDDTVEADVRFVTISFDPARDTPDRLAERAAAMGADGRQWIYAVPSPESAKTIIGTGFREWYSELDDGSFEFDPTLVLVDGWGVVRGEYQYQTLSSDTDRIVRHITILEDEINNSHGAAKLAYEAAHLFLCYP